MEDVVKIQVNSGHEERTHVTFFKKRPRSSMVELLICNQRVGGSNPSVGSSEIKDLSETA